MKNLKSYALKTVALFLLPLSVSISAQTAQTFTDPRDGKTYRTVKIGEQVWMGENLNYETDYSRCYMVDTSYCKRYGRMYQWDTAMEVCPAGWRLPDTSDWNKLVNFVGGKETAGTKLKSKSPNWNGTDDYGFSAVPGGYRVHDCMLTGACFHLLGEAGWLWMATKFYNSEQKELNLKYVWTMYSDNPSAIKQLRSIYYWASVRCLRD
jgi:uncharacterized protein (TIGR02145 family)